MGQLQIELKMVISFLGNLHSNLCPDHINFCEWYPKAWKQDEFKLRFFQPTFNV